MPKGDASLGEFEQIVLLAVLRLGDDEAYGMQVRREIAERTGRDVSIGAVYATLERLESKGLVRSATGEATAERGGKAKRLFAVTAQGKRAVEDSQRAVRSMLEGLKLNFGKRA
jgi:PadR family transcriptional regulator, regulatory protein PadR